MNLALFDLDNTLLSGDSDFEWAQFLIGKGVVDREIQEAKNIEFYEQYKAGTLDIQAFLAFQLAPLTRHPRAELDAWHAEYLERHIRPLIGEPARALVRKHQDDGDLCALVTATNSFVTGPIAREFGVAHLIATVPERHTGLLRAGMTTFALPIPTPEVTVSLLWHPRLDADPAHRWLRGCVREACAERVAEPLRRRGPAAD